MHTPTQNRLATALALALAALLYLWAAHGARARRAPAGDEIPRAGSTLTGGRGAERPARTVRGARLMRSSAEG